MSQTADAIHQKVVSQFAPNAASYVTSQGHANREVIGRLVDLVDPRPTDSLLDVATGAGHVALNFAPRVGRAVALDLTQSMLDQVERQAAEQGLSNVSTHLGKAEELPFPDGSFDIVTVRLAPHHFSDVPCFLRESARVLQPNGKFLLVDSTAPDDDAVDQLINHLELLRDPSHVRSYRPGEWIDMIEAAGLAVVHQHVGLYADGHRMELTGWMDRIGTPEENREELKGIFFDPVPELVEALKIERVDDVVTFALPEMTVLAVKR